MAAIGIDLGTTNSCVAAVMPDGTAQTIVNVLGKRTTPSVVGFCGRKIYFGENALGNIKKYPRNVLYDVKYIIGRKFTDPKVQAMIKEIGYSIINNNGSINIRLDNSDENISYKPEQVCGLLLKELKSYAETRLDEPVEVAVLTVPTYFEDSSRQATIDAGLIAGFKTVHLLNEPSAAALAYGHKFDQESTVLVFDLGGGTFDVSVLRLQKDKCSVLAIDGDLHLGGNDIDKNMVKYILDKIKNDYGQNISDKIKVRRLKNLCEQAKINLSVEEETEIDITQCLGKDEDVEININRDTFNKLNEEVFKKCMKIMEQCLERIHLKKEDVDAVLLVGGSSRNPYIRSQIKNYFKNVKIDINPDESVAIGAAIRAASLSKSSLKEVTVHQLTAHSLGIKVLYLPTNEFIMSIIIPRFSKVPIKTCRTFGIFHDDNPGHVTEVYSGESNDLRLNTLLGTFTIDCTTEHQENDITFEVNANGILEVTIDIMQGASGRFVITLDKDNLIRTKEIEMLSKGIEKLYIENKKIV